MLISKVNKIINLRPNISDKKPKKIEPNEPPIAKTETIMK